MDGRQELWLQRWLYGAATVLGQFARPKPQRLLPLLRPEELEGAVLWVDREGRILAGNAAAVTTYGYWPGELSRLRLADLASPRAAAGDTIHRRKDGSLFFVEMEQLSAPAEGDGIRLIRIHDVTTRRQAEAVNLLIGEIEQSLRQGQPVSDALQTACQRLVYLFGFTLVWVRATLPDRHLLGAGLAGPDVEGTGESLGETVRVDAHLKLPLTAAGEQVGTLAVVQGRPAPIDPGTATLLRRFADRLAQALLEARALVNQPEEQLRVLAQLALLDPLTNLPNRRVLQERFAAVMARVSPERPAALVLMDLDRFKRVNDTYGHPAGDRLLVQVARRLAEALRPQDLLVRLGGDEFAVLLEDVTPDAAEEIAERLRDAVGRVALVEQGHVVRTRLSAGVCPVQRPVSLEDAVASADRALYEAKAWGRNCVKLANRTPGVLPLPLRRRVHR